MPNKNIEPAMIDENHHLANIFFFLRAAFSFRTSSLRSVSLGVVVSEFGGKSEELCWDGVAGVLVDQVSSVMTLLPVTVDELVATTDRRASRSSDTSHSWNMFMVVGINW